MSYAVKEMYYTLQGEGANAGRAAVFLRFAGCNLWTGREEDRSTAICQFCDTDFVGMDGPGGGRFDTATDLARAVADYWPADASSDTARLVVCTGGEPLLQLDDAAIQALHAEEFEVAVETNGTLDPPEGLDWVCVSPKAGTDLRIVSGDELKLVFPQAEAMPDRFVDLAFTHRFLQPMDGPETEKNTALAIEYCMADPRWRLGIQTHKYLGIA
jgi:7-carboxy-7-deazaguanine synthase (Cx14CxxC type)